MLTRFPNRARSSRSTFPFVALVAALLPVTPTPAADEATVTFESLLEDMTRHAALAEFPEPAYTCGQFSSYDRASTSPDDPETWFANRDYGNVLRVEQHGDRTEGVLMEAEGPGAIVRIWSANPSGVLRIYLDGESSPSIVLPMEQWLGGGMPIGAPLSAVTAQGHNSYLPIPYASHCKITCDAHEELSYQINYRTYPPGTSVETFRNIWGGDGMRIIEEYNARLREPTVRLGDQTPIDERLASGQSITVYESDNGGAISLLELRMSAFDREKALRGCILRCEFDGRTTVHCPVGDFFGSAPGQNPYESLPIAIRDDGAMISRWFMPYQQSARITIENDTDQLTYLSGRVGRVDYDWSDRSMHFHALWRADGPIETRPHRDWNYATLEGRGVWVGDALHVGNTAAAWWGEGDEKIYVDGDSFPSHFGTGTDAYYGYGRGGTEVFSAPLHNQTRCDSETHFGFTSVNRFRMLDAIPFQRSLRFDMGILHESDTKVHYAATSYFYGRDVTHNVPAPPSNMRDLLPPNLKELIWRRRGALEGEDLRIVVKTDGCETSTPEIGSGVENTWSSMAHLLAEPTAVGDYVLLKCPVEDPGEYEVIVYFTRGPDYGVVQCTIDGRKAGDPIDLHAPGSPQPPKGHSLGVRYLARVGFSLGVRVVDSNPQATGEGLAWGLDCVMLKPVD